jgi:leucyl-tRNA synthetase
MELNFTSIEDKWKKYWADNSTYKVTEDTAKPKYYVLDMFPYPSGAGLHVGHPLGYVASDIYSRYKKMKGFNVLHPMGYDAFGLPAEQYAIETGTHPAITTENAIARYREQLDKIGFNYDWSRMVKTCEPSYYKWTQWIFLKLYGSWYNRTANKAELIDTLIARFEKEGLATDLVREDVTPFTAEEWTGFTENRQHEILMSYRLAYLSYAEVNWCEALGTVLANDEVKDGKSERGGHPVERRKMRQWFLRITEYSDRLLDGLETLDWSESMKDMQRNWIGRSEGATINFVLTPGPSPKERGKATNEEFAATDEGAAGYMTGDLDVSGQNIIFAKQNRKEPTPQEELLWQELRNEKLGDKFRRQHLIDKYIVDFVCLKKRLVIEVDGSVHNDTEEHDEGRSYEIAQRGFTVIRFTNNEVEKDLKTVLQKIKQELTRLRDVTLDSPLSQKEDESPSPSERDLGRGHGVLQVFTTRPDTIFGATFMVIAAEHELVEQLTTPEQKAEVDNYITYVKSKTDVERQAEKKVTGVFTGSYAINPFSEQPIPVWIAEYVLAGYGTGAIMAVPADDERDRKFAEKFGLPIIDIVDKSMYPGATIEDKLGKMINSGFLNGMEVKDAIKAVIDEAEKRNIGTRKINYKQRDAGYSRQRYWGEPFPIKFKVQGEPDSQFADMGEHDDIPMPLSEDELPVVLPEVESYKPGGSGKGPLANNKDWVAKGMETDTMPGYAGSSWYFLRYMDPTNEKEFAAKENIDYWQSVDLYAGGSEHAVGHLLYSRMWHKFLHDLGYVPTDEPFKKLVNQGMIQGRSAYAYRLNVYGVILETEQTEYYISSDVWNVWKENTPTAYELLEKINTTFSVSITVNPELEKIFSVAVSKLPVPITFIDDSDFLKIDDYKASNERIMNEAVFACNKDGKFLCEREVEKMSKSKYNVVNPDDVIAEYGADCFRMFLMFLGPIEQSKPWDDKGISGVSNFMRKLWRLFHTGAEETLHISDTEPTAEEYKVLHKTIKKITEDIERMSYNTCISAFMICVNELSGLKCNKRKILAPLVQLLAPFAPFISEELWQMLGNEPSVHHAAFPEVEQKYLVENSFEYPVSVNGKVRAHINLALDMSEADVQQAVLAIDKVQQQTNGNPPKKFIFVKGRIINVVV